jgi:hypothetical protein
MIRPQILSIKDKKDLRKLSSKFSQLVGQQQIGHTLVIADGDDNQVLTSKDVEKILIKLRTKDNSPLTFVTVNVTIEAGHLLKEKNIYLLQTRDFFWTDNEYSQNEEHTDKFMDAIKQRLHEGKLKSET